jgi:hypothetical protein
MAINVCYGCGQLFHSDIPGIFCTASCKSVAHRKLVPSRPRPKPTTLSVDRAFEVLADAAGSYEAYHGRMRKRTS